MPGRKKKQVSKKKVVRHGAPDKSSKTGGRGGKSSEREKPRLPQRVKEQDSGLGVLKWVAFIILGLVIASALLFKEAGGPEAERGDKMEGESCEKTKECAKGSICYVYKGEKRQCMKTCRKDKPCGPGYTCVSSASQQRRKGIRVTDVCVEDAKR
jgi:hypothetical protein